jgi:prepilin-type N-terminal cleavage/methylation domain-containing protein
MRGFSLIELSIVMLIVAIMTTGGLGIGSKMMMTTKIRETRAKVEAVHNAISAYIIANNNVIPLPKDNCQKGNNFVGGNIDYKKLNLTSDFSNIKIALSTKKNCGNSDDEVDITTEGKGTENIKINKEGGNFSYVLVASLGKNDFEFTQEGISYDQDKGTTIVIAKTYQQILLENKIDRFKCLLNQISGCDNIDTSSHLEYGGKIENNECYVECSYHGKLIVVKKTN